MRPADNRSNPIAFADLSEIFRQVGGYAEIGNQELAGVLERWDLLDEDNRTDVDIARSFLKWSFAASFLQLLNAIQWLMSSLLLQRTSYLPAQTMQQRYYSIFFSFGSFLAIHGKGLYTVRTESISGSFALKPILREVWIEEGPPPRIDMKEMGRGGSHVLRANWFYEVFKNWDQRDDYPAVLMFDDDRKFHTVFRNMFTYELASMAEELHHDAFEEPISNESVLGLWNRDDDLIEIFPEDFWALEHLKSTLDLHSKLIENFGDGAPLSSVQEYMVTSLLSRHKDDGVADVLSEILAPIIARIPK